MDPFIPEYAFNIQYVTLDRDMNDCVKLSYLDRRLYWSARINRFFRDCVERKAGAVMAAFPPLNKKPPIGFIAMREINALHEDCSKPNLTELVTLVVHPDYRKRGIGATLVQRAIQAARFPLHGFFPLESTQVANTIPFFSSRDVKPWVAKSRLCSYRPKREDIIHLRMTTEHAPYVINTSEWIEFWLRKSLK